MCTAILFHRVLQDTPAVLLANRDEWTNRPSSPPSSRPPRKDAPRVLCGTDEREGGTWLGVNEAGLVLTLLNYSVRPPDQSKRSRGLVCLDWLCERNVEDVIRAATRLEAGDYNAFQVLASDGSEAVLVRCDGECTVRRLSPGIHAITNWVTGRKGGEKAGFYQRKAAELLDEHRRTTGTVPTFDDMRGSLQRLAAHHRSSKDPWTSLCCHAPGYGTVSSSLVAVTNEGIRAYLYADGPPCETKFEPVAIPMSWRTSFKDS